MNTRSGFIIHTAFAFLFIALTSASAQNAPGLEASDPHWGPSPTVGAKAHSFPVDRGQAANNPPTSEVSALLRNAGQKAIKSVTWKYLFYKDEKRTEVVGSYRFHSGTRIEPGASVRLKESVAATSEPRQRTNYQAVNIIRVKYADGTVWQAAEISK
ncbi:MAG TPA: hypothetical protein VNO24_04270 [Blastocatellia bacterium]|nr:hypothetical protein [Blastocatellia bacterium]